MGEWKEYKLGDVEEVQTGTFGSQLHQRDYQLVGTPIITVEHLGENKILHQNLPLVGDEDKKRLNKYLLEEGDIVFSRVGSVDYRRFFTTSPKDKLSIILQAEEHILGLENGKERFIREVTLLSQAFALSIPHETALAAKDEVSFFQAVKARLVKFVGTGTGKSDKDIETAIKQIIDEALSSDQVIDIFAAAGIKKPEISILSE